MIHPLLERELSELTLELIHCNGIWHGRLWELGNSEPIWYSRGEHAREPVEKRAADFAEYKSITVTEL